MNRSPDEAALMEALKVIGDAVRRGSDATEPDLSMALGLLDDLPVPAVATSFGLIERHARLMAASLPVHYLPRYADAIGHEPNLSHLLLLHPDGRARRAALEAFVEAPQLAFYLALIFPRLNDWVPEVRACAEVCLNRTTMGRMHGPEIWRPQMQTAPAKWCRATLACVVGNSEP